MVFSAGKCEFSKKLYYTRAPADVNSCFLGHETPLREGHLASKTSSTHSRLRKTIVIREDVDGLRAWERWQSFSVSC